MVGDSNIVSSNSACNLGVIFDKCIKLDYHHLQKIQNTGARILARLTRFHIFRVHCL